MRIDSSFDDGRVDRVLEGHAAEIVVDDLRFNFFVDRALVARLRVRGLGLRCRGLVFRGGCLHYGGGCGRIRLLVQHFVPYRGYRRRAGWLPGCSRNG